MLLIDHYVAKSAIHGLGVFSSENVTKGKLIWEFNPIIDSEILESKLLDLPPHVVKIVHKHAWYHPRERRFWLGGDGDYYMNHEDAPTLEVSGHNYFASRNICIGDELTCDYRYVNVLDFDLKSSQGANVSAGK